MTLDSRLQKDLYHFFVLSAPDTKRDAEIEAVHTSDDAANALCERLDRYTKLGKGLERSVARKLIDRVHSGEMG
jgi:hypothetical protein